MSLRSGRFIRFKSPFPFYVLSSAACDESLAASAAATTTALELDEQVEFAAVVDDSEQDQRENQQRPPRSIDHPGFSEYFLRVIAVPAVKRVHFYAVDARP